MQHGVGVAAGISAVLNPAAACEPEHIRPADTHNIHTFSERVRVLVKACL